MLKNVKEKISISKIGQNKYYKIKVYVFQGFVEMSEVETNCGALPAHYAAAKGDLTCLKLMIGQAPGYSVTTQTLTY